jgi:phage virion morphogenesis protein
MGDVLMAGVSLTGDWKKLSGRLSGMVSKMQHAQTMTEAMGEALASSTKQRFKTETDPEGNKWEPSIRAMTEGGKTLTDTAVLKNSIGYEATKTHVAVGTNVVYGAIHQLGGKAGRGLAADIPERPFLGVSDADMEELKGIAEDFIQEGL